VTYFSFPLQVVGMFQKGGRNWISGMDIVNSPKIQKYIVFFYTLVVENITIKHGGKLR